MAGHDNNIANGEDTMDTSEIEPTHGRKTPEYNMLDSKLDELNVALDFLEQKTDDINEKLKELLQSNIEIRNEIRNENLKSNQN